MNRRSFLNILAGSTPLVLTGWRTCDNSDLIVPDDELTPSQTEGPFYPVPTIEQQMFNDPDLTRKLPADSLARGQVVDIFGTIRDVQGAPVQNAVVQIWQASDEGLYNHPSDAQNDPNLDQDFQFWGQYATAEDGAYEFKTIIPGPYAGRPARHIHFRVDSPNFSRLSTQSYFSQFGDDNSRDFLYRGLGSEGQSALTVEFGGDPLRGEFNIIVG